jgi:hypothetical protein
MPLKSHVRCVLTTDLSCIQWALGRIRLIFINYHALIDTTHFVHSGSGTVCHVQLKSKHYLRAPQFELLTSLPRPLHGGCTDLEIILSTEGETIPVHDIGAKSST